MESLPMMVVALLQQEFDLNGMEKPSRASTREERKLAESFAIKMEGNRAQ